VGPFVGRVVGKGVEGLAEGVVLGAIEGVGVGSCGSYQKHCLSNVCETVLQICDCVTTGQMASSPVSTSADVHCPFHQ
jgi:hypothetical protein